MDILSGHEGSAFSPNGILRVTASDAENPLETALEILRKIQA
jgi:hypothetical protein